MAEETGELKSVDKLDPVSTAAGAGTDEFLEKYADNTPLSGEGAPDLATREAPEDTEHIKARIEETRNQMGDTIDAIQERLSFANISEQVSETVGLAIESAKDTAYDATIGKVVNFMKNFGDEVTHSGAFRTVRSNPVPFALIGLGTGLLAYQALRGGQGSSRTGNGRGGRRVYDRGEGERSTFDSARESVGDAASRAYEGVAGKAGTALESVGNVAGSALESVSGAVTNAYTGAGYVAHRAYERAGEYGIAAHEKYDEYLEENPLALGAVALAVGAAVGFAIPSTQYEGKLMGEARENLMLRAQDAAGSLVDKAKQAATEAGQTIKDEARSLTE